MSINHLLSSILRKDCGALFYTFANADGKQWIMPAQAMKTAMNLYQPSGIKGRCLKVLFPHLHRIKIIRNIVRAECRQYELTAKLNNLLCRLFNTDNIEFAIFCGTPCVHQKITMQISHGTRILGYAKFSDNDEIKKIFKQENDTLNYLWQRGFDSVPQCLYSGELTDGIDIFVQTTTKTKHSLTDHRWGKRETAFINELHEKTNRHLAFEQTDYHHDLSQLKEYADMLPQNDADIILNGIDRVMNHFADKEVCFSFYHGDFTPWNIYVKQNKLFAFDLEYAKRTYPPHLDYFHFFTQTAIFEKHLDAKNIATLYQQHKDYIKSLFTDIQPDFAYLCYLLGIIAHYAKREKGKFNGDVKHNLLIWFDLIKYLSHTT